MNTAIHYMYRDADNYKEGEDVIFTGEITDTEKKLILSYRDEKQYFIPSQVGLYDLQNRMTGFPNDSDHVWHELRSEDITLTENNPTEEIDIHEFAKKFADIEWNVSQAMENTGITF